MYSLKMIEINLLPEGLRLKKTLTSKINLIIYLVLSFLLIVILVNIIVLSLATVKNLQFKALNKKWETLGPQRQRLEELTRSSDTLSQDLKAIQQLTAMRVLWSGKINRLSLLLPPGVWFNEVSLNKNDFIIRGSVISLKKEEVRLINQFLNSLKADKLFFNDFNNLELVSVERRSLGGYEIVDFIFNGNIKTK